MYSKILILLFSILVIATGCNSRSTNLDSASDTNRVISEDDSSLYYKFYNGDTIGIAINKTNMQGQKVGRWLESYTTDYTSIADVFYISGQKNGRFIYFGINADKIYIHTVGLYVNNKMTGVWYHYSNDVLLYSADEFEYSEFPFNANLSLRITNYYKDGHIKSQGRVYAKDFYEIDYIEYGIWRYYDTNGEISEEKDLGDGSDAHEVF